jgi:hypothetical protein
MSFLYNMFYKVSTMRRIPAVSLSYIRDIFLKFWRHYATLYIFIIFNNQPFAEARLLVSSLLLRLTREEPPWGAEPRIEFGPALQQTDPLPTGLRHTLTELRHTLYLSYAAL